MNKIISNHHISPEIIDLIKNSEKYVVLISPYLYLWKHLKDEIIKCSEREVKVLLIIKSFEKESPKNKSSIKLNNRMDILEETLKDFVSKGIEIYTNESLHTKLYMSEKLGLVSSMNLYDYSMKSNQELGIVIDDDKTQKQLNEYVKELKSNSSNYNPIDIEDDMDIPDRFGFCIRCGKNDTKEPEPSRDIDSFILETIDRHFMEEEGVDPEDIFQSTNYLCKDCLPIWEKYGKNEEFPEKYCFVCGEKNKTSVKRPFCKDCTYERKWNDDAYKEEIRKNIKDWFSDNSTH